MKRVYEFLLRLYPRDYRAVFAKEMSNAFEQGLAERRDQGWGAAWRFALAELVGLTIGAGIEWIAKLSTDSSIRGRSLSDRPLNAGAFPNVPEEVSNAQQRTELLVKRIVHAISHHDYIGARRYSDEERIARESLRLLRQKYQINE